MQANQKTPLDHRRQARRDACACCSASCPQGHTPAAWRGGGGGVPLPARLRDASCGLHRHRAASQRCALARDVVGLQAAQDRGQGGRGRASGAGSLRAAAQRGACPMSTAEAAVAGKARPAFHATRTGVARPLALHHNIAWQKLHAP